MSSVKFYYIKCQVSGDKYSMASTGVRNQVMSIAWQVLVSRGVMSGQESLYQVNVLVPHESMS